MSWVSPFHLRLAERHLRRGGLVAYPTEGVFGFGCDPLNPKAVGELLRLKGRPLAKGFILIAESYSQVEPYLNVDSELRERLLSIWPGPVTWVVPAQEWVPAWLRGASGDLAVRVTAHPVAAALCRQFGGPLVSTSANRTGTSPARTALTLRKHFGKAQLLSVPGRVGSSAGPTAIFDARSGKRLR